MKKKILNALTAWLDADYNRAVFLTSTHAGYQCQLQYVINGKRKWGCAWNGDTLEEAIDVAISSEEWLHD